MMRLICGVLLALLCAVSCAGADSKSLSSKEKYHPGHYILISQRNSVSDEAWDTNPNVRGIQKRYSWMTLEPKKGEYDFSEVRRDLEICAKNGKYLVIFFNDKTFKRDDQRMPDYLLNITVPVSYGANPLRWTPEYKERFKLLIDRLAEEFDDNPYFEGFTFQESALAFSRGELDNEPEARQ